MAGGYDALTQEEFKYYFLESTTSRRIIYGCNCGIVECWPLFLEIEEKNNTVMWHNFKQGFRDWKYDLEFQFDKNKYLEEIERLAIYIIDKLESIQ